MSNRIELKLGSKINLKEVESGFAREYKIEKVLGKGNTCIVYEVSYVENGVDSTAVLKEFYPKDYVDKINRKGDVLVYDESIIAKIKEEQAYFEHAYKEQKKLNNIESIRNYIVSPISYLSNTEMTGTSGTYYILSERVTGDILANYKGKLSLKEIFELALSLSNALEKLHKLGRLYLDLKPENIFITPPKEGISVRLFDVDTMIEKSELKRVIKEKSSIRLGASPDWLSPEQEEISIRGLNEETIKKINEKTDYYQLGLLIKDLLEEAIDGTDFLGENLFIVDKNSYIFKDINPSVFNKIERFFTKILARNQRDRYLNIESLKSAIKEIISISDENIAFIKHTPFYSKEKFIGRTSEIEAIDKYFEKEEDNSTVVYLEGIGGIGKSELAKRYAKIREEDYNRVFYINYETNLKYSLVRGLSIPGINITGGDIEDVYRIWYSKARELIDNEMLLVIDNMNEDDEDIKEVFKLGCKVLISTRKTHNKEDNNVVEVNELKQEDVLELFKVESKLEEEEYSKNKETIQKILEVFKSHTMAVEIAARQMLDLGYTVEEYYEVLEEGISKLETEVSIKKDGVNKDREPIDHFRLLFKINELSAEEIELLKILAVVPTDGINKRKLFDYLELDSKEKMATEKVVKSLSSKSVLYKDGRVRNISLRLHPLIRELIIEDHKPNVVDGSQVRYINNVLKGFGVLLVYNDIKDNLSLLKAYTASVIRIGEYNLNSDTVILCAKFLNEYAYYDEALAMLVFVRDYLENHKNEFINQKGFFSLYELDDEEEEESDDNVLEQEENIEKDEQEDKPSSTGSSALKLWMEKAIESLGEQEEDEDVLEQEENVEEDEQEDKPSSTGSSARRFWMEKAIKSLAEPEEDEEDDFQGYFANNIDLDDLDLDGIDFDDIDLDDEMDLSKSIMEFTYYMQLSVIFNLMGNIYVNIGRYDEGIECFEKSIFIFIDTADADDEEFVILTYNNLGVAYLKKFDTDNSFKYFKKALDLLSKSEIIVDDLLPNLYCNIGFLYGIKGEYEKSLEYMIEAKNECMTKFGNESTLLAKIYNNLAMRYFAIGEEDKAMEYTKAGMQMSQKFLGEKNFGLAFAYANLAAIYSEQGRYEEAINILNQAIDVAVGFIGPYNIDVAVMYESIADVYIKNGQEKKALESYETALEIGQKIFDANNSFISKIKNKINKISKKL